MVEGQTDQDQQHADTSLASLQSSCSALSQDVSLLCDDWFVSNSNIGGGCAGGHRAVVTTIKSD